MLTGQKQRGPKKSASPKSNQKIVKRPAYVDNFVVQSRAFL